MIKKTIAFIALLSVFCSVASVQSADRGKRNRFNDLSPAKQKAMKGEMKRHREEMRKIAGE